MQPGYDVRKVDLWEGKTSDEIWTQYRDDLDRGISALFDPDRPRAFAEVREGIAPPSPGDGGDSAAD